MQTVRKFLLRIRKFGVSGRVSACLLIGLLTLCRYRVSYDAAFKVPQQGESFALARSLAQTGQFANPFHAMHTGPSAHLAPLFPAFLAALIRIFGEGSAGVFAYEISAVLAVSVLVALLPAAGVCLGIGFGTGAVAALAWLAAKPPLYSGWECTYAALLALIATFLFRKVFEMSSRMAGLVTIVLGAIVGLFAYVLPTAVPVILVWLLCQIWRRGVRKSYPQYLRLLLLPVLMVLPWIARNYVVLHRIVPVRDNLGLELAVSNVSVRATHLFRCWR